MAIFIDSSNLEEIKEISNWSILSGVTTNPKILASDPTLSSVRARILEIMDVCSGPISVELTSDESGEMVREASEYVSWNPQRIVIKIPIGSAGLKVAKILTQEHKFKVNITAVMSFNQAYLACLAAATYVSIFWGRIKDMGYDPSSIVLKVREMIDREKLGTKIIVGSLRQVTDVNEALSAGAHIATVPPEILRKMTWNPQTDATINEFNRSWEKSISEKD